MRLGGEVDDRVDAVERRRDRGRILDRAVDEREARVGLDVAGGSRAARRRSACRARRSRRRSPRSRTRTKFEPMKPAPPQTSSLIADRDRREREERRRGPPARAAAARRRARRRARSRPAAAPGARAQRWSSAVTRTSTPGRGEDRLRELVARAVRRRRPRGRCRRAAAAASSSSFSARCPVKVGQPTWSVTTATSSRPAAASAQHRRDEVAAARAEQPRGAHDRVPRRGGEHRALAGELACARRPCCGAGRIGLDVRPRRACRRRRSRSRRGRAARPRRARRAARCPAPVAVDRERRRLVGLGAVDVGPRGAVDDHLGRALGRPPRATAPASVMSSSPRAEADAVVAARARRRRRRRGRASRRRR